MKPDTNVCVFHLSTGRNGRFGFGAVSRQRMPWSNTRFNLLETEMSKTMQVLRKSWNFWSRGRRSVSNASLLSTPITTLSNRITTLSTHLFGSQHRKEARKTSGNCLPRVVCACITPLSFVTVNALHLLLFLSEFSLSK